MNENEKKPITRQEFEKQIIQKAQSDKDFRKALVNNPKVTLGQLGVQVPEEVEIKVVEESAKLVYLVLPCSLDELTDEQLDAVSGGLSWWNWFCSFGGTGDVVWFDIGGGAVYAVPTQDTGLHGEAAAEGNKK